MAVTLINKTLIALVFAVLSAGCSSMRVVDSEVRAFSSPPGLSLPANFRFERLPSQQANADGQDQLEVAAQTALAKVGMTRHDTAASYSVQISYGTLTGSRRPGQSADSGWSSGVNVGVGVHTGNLGLFVNGPLWRWGDLANAPRPYYWREVSLTVREVRSGSVVYETRAAHDSAWSDAPTLLPALLDAALTGFPAATVGPKRVNIEIPR